MITFCNDIYAKNDVSTTLQKTYLHPVISKNDVSNILYFITSNLKMHKIKMCMHVNLCWRQLILKKMDNLDLLVLFVQGC